MRLQDKVIIVTGSTTGIGKAIALRCVSEGASIVVSGLEENWGKALVFPHNLGLLNQFWTMCFVNLFCFQLLKIQILSMILIRYPKQ